MTPVRRATLLIGGCIVLGIGVGMLLTADLGADGFSTIVYGATKASGLPFVVANVGVASLFLLAAAVRRVRPGVGTLVQIVLVGGVVTLVLQVLETPSSLPARIALFAVAVPVLATGVAAYLGSHLGAGPAEALGLAWDPPIPFKWSYSAVQLGSSLGGWLLGATVGVGTLASILLLGPLVDLASKVLKTDVHQKD